MHTVSEMDKIRLNRTVLIISILLHLIHYPFVSSRISLTGLKDKAVSGNFVIKSLNMQGKTFSFCLARCLEDCLCKSFQVCDCSKCEISTINKNDDESAFETRLGCVYYDLDALDLVNQQCDKSCSRSINCCLTSNPCLNGGVCLAANSISSTKSSPRFSCKCPQPYKGLRCEHSITSCRGYISGPRISGLYKILDRNQASFDVFCDFESDTSLIWTLVQSHTRNTQIEPMQLNNPISPDTPNWTGYRLHQHRMRSIQADSTKWRITCQYNGSTTLTDYVYGAIEDINILVSIVNCAKVERITIRNHACNNCTVHFFQNTNYVLHVDNDTKCQYAIPASQVMTCSNGNYFGSFECLDKDHACSSSSSATTQTWFGGY